MLISSLLRWFSFWWNLFVGLYASPLIIIILSTLSLHKRFWNTLSPCGWYFTYNLKFVVLLFVTVTLHEKHKSMLPKSLSMHLKRRISVNNYICKILFIHRRNYYKNITKIYHRLDFTWLSYNNVWVIFDLDWYIVGIYYLMLHSRRWVGHSQIYQLLYEVHKNLK